MAAWAVQGAVSVPGSPACEVVPLPGAPVPSVPPVGCG